MHFDDELHGQENDWAVPQGPAVVDRSLDLRSARDRAVSFLRDRATRPGLLARRVAGLPSSRDAQLVDQLIRERRRRTRIDGSMNGSFVETAWTAWELMDLGCPPDHSAVVRTLGWVLAKQDRPGRFGEGCTEDRHGKKQCRHFLKGFFSAGARDEDLAPLEFRSGLAVADEEEARFAASCFALRAVLRAGEDRRASVRSHVESLLQMAEIWEPLGAKLSADLAMLTLGALTFAPLEYRDQVEQFTNHIVSQQLPEGGWPNAHLFNALDMMTSASSHTARQAVRRAAPLLCALQRESGAFDETDSEEITLIGLRALRIAQREA